MSYSILAQKTFIETSVFTAASEIGSWLSEKIPELSVVQDKKSGSYTQDVCLAFNDKTYGILFEGYDYSTSQMFSIFAASGISSTTASKQGSGTQISPIVSKESGVNTYKITISVLKLGDNYMITVNNSTHCVAMYIGYVTTVLAGKRFVCLCLGTQNGAKGYAKINANDGEYTSSYANNGRAFSEDGSEFHNVASAAVMPDETNKTEGTAVLSPVYIFFKSLFAEPLVIPNVYHMTADSYPTFMPETPVGTSTVRVVANCGLAVS